MTTTLRYPGLSATFEVTLDGLYFQVKPLGFLSPAVQTDYTFVGITEVEGKVEELFELEVAYRKAHATQAKALEEFERRYAARHAGEAK